jgi:hypothetical protein
LSNSWSTRHFWIEQAYQVSLFSRSVPLYYFRYLMVVSGNCLFAGFDDGLKIKASLPSTPAVFLPL